MTNKELQEELAKYPDDYSIEFFNDDDCTYIKIVDVEVKNNTIGINFTYNDE